VSASSRGTDGTDVRQAARRTSARIGGRLLAAASTRHLLFTGKGGVGKTTVGSAVAIALAREGKQVLVVSTDPASNLDDMFGVEVGDEPIPVSGAPGLSAINIDPEAAAAAYRERTLAPYRGVVPATELASLEEQLSGQCTVEVAAFDLFSVLLGSPRATATFDHILFDTAPTGHTLRLLSLPAAWSTYLEGTPAAASCLGPLGSLEGKRSLYEDTVAVLRDGRESTVLLVSRPERSSLREAARAAGELSALGISNQRLVLNGVLEHPLEDDPVAEAFSDRQRDAVAAMPPPLKALPATEVPLVTSDLTGIAALGSLLADESSPVSPVAIEPRPTRPAPDGIDELVSELDLAGPGVVMVMGKGGVGKTTVAVAVATGLAVRGRDVHLTTTDPAGGFIDTLDEHLPDSLSVSRIEPAVEVRRYVDAKLERAAHLDPSRRALLEEDLRSPCTEEIAVFQAFSRLLREGRRRIVVVDTAPSGHTLLLLDRTGSYHRDVMRDSASIPGRITTPLMLIQDASYTRVLLVTLAEATPVHEAADLQSDLRRAGIEPFGWVINASLAHSGTRDPVLAGRAMLEHRHIRHVRTEHSSRTWLVPWLAEREQRPVRGRR
jgi:arsenite/tail-anchored protein-transporting ATPase